MVWRDPLVGSPVRVGWPLFSGGATGFTVAKKKAVISSHLLLLSIGLAFGLVGCPIVIYFWEMMRTRWEDWRSARQPNPDLSRLTGVALDIGYENTRRLFLALDIYDEFPAFVSLVGLEPDPKSVEAPSPDMRVHQTNGRRAIDLS